MNEKQRFVVKVTGGPCRIEPVPRLVPLVQVPVISKVTEKPHDKQRFMVKVSGGPCTEPSSQIPVIPQCPQLTKIAEKPVKKNELKRCVVNVTGPWRMEPSAQVMPDLPAQVMPDLPITEHKPNKKNEKKPIKTNEKKRFAVNVPGPWRMEPSAQVIPDLPAQEMSDLPIREQRSNKINEKKPVKTNEKKRLTVNVPGAWRMEPSAQVMPDLAITEQKPNQIKPITEKKPNKINEKKVMVVNVTGGPCRIVPSEVMPEFTRKIVKPVKVRHQRHVCICCLSQSGPLLSLATCNHVEFLFCISEAVIEYNDKYVCKLCHDILKKFSLFRQQVQDNIQTFLEGVLIKQENKKILNLQRTPTKHTTIEQEVKEKETIEDYLKSNGPIELEIDEAVIDADIDNTPLTDDPLDMDIELHDVSPNLQSKDIKAPKQIDTTPITDDPLDMDIELHEVSPNLQSKDIKAKQNIESVNKPQENRLSLWNYEPVLVPDVTKNIQVFGSNSCNNNVSDDMKERRQKERQRIEAELRREALDALKQHSIVTPAERQYRVWKKSVLLVLRRLCAHKHGSVFLRPIKEERAPGYSLVVKRPMDLTTIRRNIETGVIRTTAEFHRDVLLMLSNARMYNPTQHSVYKMAMDLHEEAENQLNMLEEAEEHAAQLDSLSPHSPVAINKRRKSCPSAPLLQSSPISSTAPTPAKRLTRSKSIYPV